MKNYIFSYSQKIAVEMGLTTDDLLFLRWFVDFKECGKMDKKYMKDINDMGYWVSYNKIINDLPIIFGDNTGNEEEKKKKMIANKKKVQRMLNGNLKQVITREFTPIKEGGGKVYLSLVAENYFKLIHGEQDENEPIEENQENQGFDGYGQNCTEGMDNNIQGGLYCNVQSDSPIDSYSPINNSTEQNSIDTYNNIINKAKEELNCSDLSNDDNVKNTEPVFPKEFIEESDLWFRKGFSKDKRFFNLDFTSGIFYMKFSEAFIKAMQQDMAEILTEKQYAWFSQTLYRMLKTAKLI